MSDPFAWLADMLTGAWGEPRVAPPAEPDGRIARIREADGLIWVRSAEGIGHRRWAWAPDGRKCQLLLEQGGRSAVRMSVPGQRATLSSDHGTWDGLTRETVEPVARWVYGLQGDGHSGSGPGAKP
jgi:hypothetical protein